MEWGGGQGARRGTAYERAAEGKGGREGGGLRQGRA